MLEQKICSEKGDSKNVCFSTGPKIMAIAQTKGGIKNNDTLNSPLGRGLAQLASAPALGAGGREFESRIPDPVENIRGSPPTEIQLSEGGSAFGGESAHPDQIHAYIFRL
jgi:hypothetical protein